MELGKNSDKSQGKDLVFDKIVENNDLNLEYWSYYMRNIIQEK